MMLIAYNLDELTEGVMKRQHLVIFLYGLLSGLFSAGIILLFLNRPKRYPIELLPPPSPAPLRIHITGAVTSPGVYSLPHGSICADAVAIAGGSLPDADMDRINLAAPLSDGQHTYIPFQSTEAIDHSTQDINPPSPAQRLNINTASSSDLENLPGIGPSLAQKIVEYRLNHGLFLTIDDLIHVSGIGPAKLDQIRDLISCQ
jgi:competence protein ComEA